MYSKYDDFLFEVAVDLTSHKIQQNLSEVFFRNIKKLFMTSANSCVLATSHAVSRFMKPSVKPVRTIPWYEVDQVGALKKS